MRMQWRMAAGCIAVLVYAGAMIYISSTQHEFAVSVRAEQKEWEFRAEDETWIIPVYVDNNANRMLVSTDDQKCYLSYHLYDESGTLLEYDNERTAFVTPLFSGQSGAEEIRISGLEKGIYQVKLDVVKEGVAWFSENGADCDTVKLVVR